jgi:hypothetical protein
VIHLWHRDFNLVLVFSLRGTELTIDVLALGVRLGVPVEAVSTLDTDAWHAEQAGRRNSIAAALEALCDCSLLRRGEGHYSFHDLVAERVATFWYEEALDVVDAEGARKLAEMIRNASPA